MPGAKSLNDSFILVYIHPLFFFQIIVKVQSIYASTLLLLLFKCFIFSCI